MTIANYFSLLKVPIQKRVSFCRYLPMIVLICVCFLVGSPFTINYEGIKSNLGMGSTVLNRNSLCKSHGKPSGTETLPKGILSRTSNLEMWPWTSHATPIETGKPLNGLVAIAVGIKQKNVVDEMVKKFILSNFTVMLFHYDGTVDEWRDFQWSNNVLHVSAINQTKWWFAKRFLHPDVVAEYNYIFLWDEDLGVENFHPGRYVSIIEKERLEISQPALDATKCQVHYQITARLRKGTVHRRTYKFSGGGKCYENSTEPPCTGWVEMMAPVFSRAAWRCVWHMIQNDLIHAWGLDTKLGYCAQGDRSKFVGVVDSEYIVHKGIPTLGGNSKVLNGPTASNGRLEVRRRSHTELEIFQRRWKDAASADKCWIDPYSSKTSSSRSIPL
ncbi:hypothetical protein HPP92_021427 [Vanilla planifolia]|uniref:Uncharacterized protein n=1 Tax=Vanilla planifolia TaxID=51239 RepID=A0A835PYT8_VANPL|nr:hypothetical protein HPP92_021427 [Vanilla planifolia]